VDRLHRSNWKSSRRSSAELCDAIDANDIEEIVDAIGDMSVVLCVIAEMYGSDFTDVPGSSLGTDQGSSR
jgi:hypothetical protein